MSSKNGFGTTREPTMYATIRGASDLPKIVDTPYYSERGDCVSQG